MVSVIAVDLFFVRLCKAHPDWLFVFGDNLVQRGTGGQAVIRYCDNAAGIPTKRLPQMTPGSFFEDADLGENAAHIDRAIAEIESRLSRGGFTTLVLPEAGLGTGLAALNHPGRTKTKAYLDEAIAGLVERVRI